MRKIVPDLTKELLKHFGNVKNVGTAEPFLVKSFRELVEHTAKLSFQNKDNLLFYRGQVEDYPNKGGSSSFYPSIYRGDYLPLRELKNRFDILEGTGKALADLFETNKIQGYEELKKRKSIRWSILQHYGVCETPLMDFTQSLRVACSFATIEKKEFGYVFIFGLPYLTNRVSINSEHDIINVRLLSICPPTALRPYFQEGYLAGTDEITDNYESKSELDFNYRLIAKFKFKNNKYFWGDKFGEIPESLLYPEGDPINELCKQIKSFSDKQLKSGDLGDFLKSWAELEEKLLLKARIDNRRFLSLNEAIRYLFNQGLIDNEQLNLIDALRRYRNKLVHTPHKMTSNEIRKYFSFLDQAHKALAKKG